MRIPVHLFIGGGIAVFLQWFFFGRIGLWGATPDVVLLFVLWIAVRYGQMRGALTGFLLGFLLDAIYGLWGIHMFVKTLIGFLFGSKLFSIDVQIVEKSVRRVVELTLIASLLHNSIMVLFIWLQKGADQWQFIWILILCIGSTLYTTFIAFLIGHFFWRRRSGRF